jgi:hypothetical protein
MPSSNSLPLRDKLLEKIYSYGLTIWRERWTDRLEKDWLDNFQDFSDSRKEVEDLNMLYLLSKFMYFGSKEVRHLLISIFRDLYKYPIVAEIRRKNNNSTDAALIEREFKNELDATRFLGVGNPSESGVHLLYYFRQENRLKKDHFIHSSQIFSTERVMGPTRSLGGLTTYIPCLSSNSQKSILKVDIADPSIRRYVFIDDICGSGSQARGYLRKLVENIKFKDPKIEVDYFMLFGTNTGIGVVKGLNLFDRVEAVYSIDESFKAFSPSSRYYKFVPDESKLRRLVAKSIARRYGRRLVSGTAMEPFPLGWGNGQLLLGLFHNTPDNSLPIFWGEKDGWKAAFKRYDKIY